MEYTLIQMCSGTGSCRAKLANSRKKDSSNFKGFDYSSLGDEGK